MIKYILIPLALMLHFLSFGQEEGSVNYKQVIQLKFDIQGNAPVMMEKLPTESASEFILLKKGNDVLYRNVVEGGQEDIHYASGDGNEVQMDFRIQMPENILYTNLAEGQFTEQTDFLGKKFLIQGPVKKQAWKLTGKSKKVLDYACQEAILQDSSQQVVAWFAPTIPWQIGPSKYHGLPGLILELHAGEDRVIRAEEVSFDPVESAIEVPSKGKKVSPEEFEKIQDEKLKEIGATKGSGNTAIKMIIREN